MKSDSKRQFLLRWAAIANSSAALPVLTDSEIAAVAGGAFAEPLYGARVPPPIQPPPHGFRPPPIVPPVIHVEYGPAILVSGTT
jgi:hypothetical protein